MKILFNFFNSFCYYNKNFLFVNYKRTFSLPNFHGRYLKQGTSGTYGSESLPNITGGWAGVFKTVQNWVKSKDLDKDIKFALVKTKFKVFDKFANKLILKINSQQRGQVHSNFLM